MAHQLSARPYVRPVRRASTFGAGSVDPNVAAAPIGADGRACYVGSKHTSVHLIADHLGTLARSAHTMADPTGTPVREVGTRG